MDEQSTLQAAKAEAVVKYLKPNGNIVGIGIGKKQINGTLTDCLRIYVVKRQPEDLIAPAQVVPKGTTILDVPVDVIEVGPFGRNGQSPVKDTGTETRPGSPIRVKTALTNVNEGARGTLGAVVTDGEALYILSCNHILAVNGRIPGNSESAQIVSAEFVGKETEIATLCDFIPLRRDTVNAVDCAVARLLDNTSIETGFPDKTVRLTSGNAAAPRWDMKLGKVGAGTGLTHGRIVDTDVDLYIPYSFLDSVRFDRQIMIQSEPEDAAFATNGDSGAIIIDEDSGQAVGMIFASSGEFAVACPLETVLTELGKKVKSPLSLVIDAGQRKAAGRPSQYAK